MSGQHADLQPSTDTTPRLWNRNPSTVPKAADAIEVMDHDLKIVDRKLFNVILAHSLPGLREDPNRTFFATAADLKQAIGWEFKNGNREISESLLRLQRTIVFVGYWNGGQRTRRLTLLNVTDVPERDGYVYWKFNVEMAPLLADPDCYVNIHLKVSSGLTSNFAHHLYEQLTLHCRYGDPWIVSVDELRRRLGATAKAYTQFKRFKSKVLDPAIEQVDRHGPFDVRTAYHRDTSRYVVAVEFKITKRAGWFEERAHTLIEDVSETTRHRPHYIHTQDPDPEAVQTQINRLNKQTVERLRREYPGLDIEAIIHEWASWRLKTGGLQKPLKPSVDVNTYIAANYGPARGLDTEDAQAALSACINDRDDTLRLALDAAIRMGSSKRRTWISMARRLDERIPVIGGSLENLLVWVPAVTDQMKLSRLIDTGDTVEVQQRDAQLFELTPEGELTTTN